MNVELNTKEKQQKVRSVNGSRYVHPCIGEYKTMQKHAAKFLDPVTTVDGEVLPAGTVVSVTSAGFYNGKPSWGCSVWNSGRTIHIYSNTTR